MNEKKCIDQTISLRKDFIIVKYESTKHNIMYIGQAEKENCPLIKIHFLRKKAKIGGS